MRGRLEGRLGGRFDEIVRVIEYMEKKKM